MPRDVGAYLEDIRDACAAIIRVVEENDVRAYLTNRVLRSAVEREFLIIGEAVNKVLDLAPELATRLTSSRLIVDFRNRLAHEYHNIDDEMVWAIAEVDVPVLADEVNALLGEQEKN